MKTLILWAAMLPFICLCAASANADLLLDSFNYPSNAALQAAWNCSGDATLPTIATNNGVPCMDTYMDWTGTSGYKGVTWYKQGSWDLSGCTGLTLSMAATNPSQIYYPFVTLYTDNNTSYYSIADYNPLTNELQAGFCPLSWGNAGGTPNWANVSMIVFGYYLNPAAGPGDVYVSNLTAVMQSGSLNVDVTLQDYSGDLSLLPIRVDCIDSIGSVAYTATVTPAANPTTVAFANVNAGSYTIRASAAKCLSATTTISISNNTATTASLSLPNGDLDGNGTITSADLNIGLENIDQRGGQ